MPADRLRLFILRRREQAALTTDRGREKILRALLSQTAVLVSATTLEERSMIFKESEHAGEREAMLFDGWDFVPLPPSSSSRAKSAQRKDCSMPKGHNEQPRQPSTVS